MAIDVKSLISQAHKGSLDPKFSCFFISHKSALKCSKGVLYFQAFRDDEGFIITNGIVSATGKFENFPKIKEAVEALEA